MSAPLLALEAACAARGAFTLGPVSMSVGAGESVALVGPNGAGKSTLLALAVGEVRPTSGSVLLGGAPPHGLKKLEVARRVALLRQQGPPPFPIAVMDVVLHGRWSRQQGLRLASDEDVLAARGALARVDALSLASRDLASLSGGERQRVLLARALVQGSPLLLLDEPTASLDPGQRLGVIRSLLGALEGGSLGQVVVTHDLALAAELSTRAVLLAGGRMVAAGPTAEVLRGDALAEAFGLAPAGDQPGSVRWGFRR